MNRLLLLLFFCGLGSLSNAQVDTTDLLSMLGPDEPTINYATASFKTNRVINLHSLENTAGGVLDFKISHRFGFLSGGLYELFGLDQASMRLGFDYGITDRFQIGVGRSTYGKTIDGYLKFKILRQSNGARVMPITLSVFSSMAGLGTKWNEPDRTNYFTSRLYFTHQIIMGRKFNDYFTLQLSPTLVHRNLVRTQTEKNDVYALGAGARVRLSRRITLNAEYVYVLPNQLDPAYRNSVSLGVDIETGGHVFQLHFTNSTSMIEYGYITETTGDPLAGNIHFGFNISRVFTLTQAGRKQ